MLQFKYILKYLISLVVNPEQTWQFLANQEGQESKADYMQRNYYFPMWGVIAICLFLLKGFSTEEFSFEVAMKSAVSFMLSYFAGLYLAAFLLRLAFEWCWGILLDKERLQVFVGYAMSFLMAVDLLMSLMPSISFVAFVNLYLVYIVWCATISYLGVEENRRWSSTFLISAVVFCSPWLIGCLMRLMER